MRFNVRYYVFCLFIVILPFQSVGVEDAHVLRSDLQSSDLAKRVAASKKLASMRDWEGVRIAMKDTSEKVRHSAIVSLSIEAMDGRRRDPEAVEIVLNALGDKDVPVRKAALRKLEDYSTEATFSRKFIDTDICRCVAPLMQDAEKSIRVSSVNLLVWCSDAETDRDFLRVALNEKEDSEVRAPAIQRLGKTSLPDRERILLAILSDAKSDKSIQRAAIFALGGMRSQEAVKLILPFVKSDDPSLHHAAAFALGQIGDPKTGIALAETLINKNGTVDTGVLDQLGKVGSPEVVPYLLQAMPLITYASARAQLANAFGATNSGEAVAPLLKLLKDQSVSTSAFQALQRLESPEALIKIVNASHLDPGDQSLASLAKKAQWTLDHPEEASKEKKKQQEEQRILAQRSTIDRDYARGLEYFREGKYSLGLPLIEKSAKSFEMLLESYPDHFSTGIRIQQREVVADYYRWVVKDPLKAIDEYQKAVTILKRYNKEKVLLTGPYLMMGEICEKDLKEREKAISYYQLAEASLRPGENARDEEIVLVKWMHNWTVFQVDRLVASRRQAAAVPPAREMKYPDLAYQYQMKFGGLVPGIQIYDKALNAAINGTGEEVQAGRYDSLKKRYGNSFVMLSVGSSLFHQLLSKGRLQEADTFLAKMHAENPRELVVMMMQFELADAYEQQKNHQMTEAARKRGLEVARSLNITMRLGADPRFASPELTWQRMVESLKKGDIEAACECFAPNSRSRYRTTFTALKDKLSQMASDMAVIRKIKQEEGWATYDIRRKENAGVFSYEIRFINVLGEWMIYSF